MTPIEGSQGAQHLLRKSIAVHMVGGRTLFGEIHIAEGKSLTGFLGEKKHFLNVTNTRWEGSTEDTILPHLSLRLSNIVWVEPLDGSLYLTSAERPTDAGRRVELHLVGGLTLSVTLNIAAELRMSDYFDSGPAFIPLRQAQVRSTGRTIDRLAVNHQALVAIREL